MIYLGRPGLHADYVRFCVEARKRRKREAAEKRKRAAELVETIQTGLYVFLGVAAALLITFVVVQYFK